MNVRYYVGEWLVEPEQNRVVRGSESARLDPKAVQVLSFLAKHPNEVVTKEQIIGSVWDGAFVSDEVLTTAIWGLRKALGDDAKEPRYIQTIPRRGYRLIAPVEKTAGEPSGRWEPSPYPGLSAFSQRDARYFFGREAEVEALWAKLQQRHLLGVIGPSGAGKSSLLRAGVIPACPEGWGVHLCQPRNDPFRSFEGLDAWRAEHTEALVIVDQFEELFTLNDEETQGRFAEHLSGLSQSGVHVLLSMRDDFLIRCHTQPALAAVFEKLTPVLPLEGAALRQALTDPARACGYRFEDEALVSEILAEVSRERGALPLLAFAASKLWEKRDREERLLTREAYLAVGRVAGALAKHAEEALSAIGVEHEPMVREIFRNLVSGQGTRVPTEREELLTVFGDREIAANVLGKLIDARLLTSAGEQVEIIHESLLTAWPRLVRWQTQDADDAVFRDQLRQASRAWVDRGRPHDLLWTGTSYRELDVFRERYSGGLTATEKEFAEAAARLSERMRRRRRVAVAALVGASVVVAAVTSSLWQRSRAEALRAEASKVLALGQLELETNPTAALAYAIKSLELSDTREARWLALRVLQDAPAATVQMVEQEGGLEAHGGFGRIEQPFRRNYFTAKYTQQLGAKNRLDVRYAYEDNIREGDQIGDGFDPNVSRDQAAFQTNDLWSVLGRMQMLVSTSGLNDLVFQASDFTNVIQSVLQPDFHSYGAPTLYFTSATFGQNGGAPESTFQRKYQFRDTFSYSLDTHDLKFGGEVLRGSPFGLDVPFFGQFFSYDDDGAAADEAHFFTQLEGVPPMEIPYAAYGFFAQDDWRVRDSLTLNLGLRYDVESGTLSNVPYGPNGELLTTDPRSPYVGMGPLEDDEDNWAPRIGFAWDVGSRGETVVRGGYGLFYDKIVANTTVFTMLDALGLRGVSIENPGFGPEDIPPFDELFEIAGFIVPFGSVVVPGFQVPKTEQLTIGVSRQLAPTLALDADYVRSRGDDRGKVADINERRLPDDNASRRFSPERNSPLFVIEPRGFDRYDGLQLSLRNRFTGRIQFTVNYTLGRLRGNAESGFGQIAECYACVGSDRDVGPHRNDTLHNFVVGGFIALPADFQVSTLIQAESGRALTAGSGGDPDGNGRPRFHRGSERRARRTGELPGRSHDHLRRSPHEALPRGVREEPPDYFRGFQPLQPGEPGASFRRDVRVPELREVDAGTRDEPAPGTAGSAFPLLTGDPLLNHRIQWHILWREPHEGYVLPSLARQRTEGI